MHDLYSEMLAAYGIMLQKKNSAEGLHFNAIHFIMVLLFMLAVSSILYIFPWILQKSISVIASLFAKYEGKLIAE